MLGNGHVRFGGRRRGNQPAQADTAPRRRPYTSRCPTAPPSSSSKSSPNARGSLIVITNLPFGEWTKVFPDPPLAKAVVDRRTHPAHNIDTGTESWRLRHPPQPQDQHDRLTPRARPRELSPLHLALRGVAPATTARGTHPQHGSGKINNDTNQRDVGHFKPSRRGQAKPSLSQPGLHRWNRAERRKRNKAELLSNVLDEVA